MKKEVKGCRCPSADPVRSDSKFQVSHDPEECPMTQGSRAPAPLRYLSLSDRRFFFGRSLAGSSVEIFLSREFFIVIAALLIPPDCLFRRSAGFRGRSIGSLSYPEGRRRCIVPP